MRPFFFFGSLRDHALLEVVLGRSVAAQDVIAAKAPGYAALTLAHEPYPYLAEMPGASANGVVVRNLTAEDMARLEYFEDTEYGVETLSVQTSDGETEAQYFAATPTIAGMTRDLPWDFEAWVRDERAIALEAAAEYMDHLGIDPLEGVDIWPGIKTRAIMRARAKAAMPVTGGLRAVRAPQDVETIAIGRPYTGFFAIEQHRLRHRRFDGSLSPEIDRLAVTSGDAATVIPYDPRTDRVLLIEQFRAPMHARGDACPWAIEAVAGRLDQESGAEACVRREAQEEAGLTLGRLERIAEYYPTPGIAAEHITSFIGEAALDGTGGLYGVQGEHEDIRAFVVPLDDALAGVTSGEINNAPAILSLLWLGQHRDRLRACWA